MPLSILSSVLLAFFGGDPEDPSPALNSFELQAEESSAASNSLPRWTFGDPEDNTTVDAFQDPPPQQPPDRPRREPAPPPREPAPPPPPEATSPPAPFTFSANGRVPFPLGSMRFGTFSGGSTALGQRVRYEDLFHRSGWGAGVELSMSMSDWSRHDVRTGGDRDADRDRGPAALDRHSSGFYLSGQYDRFRGDTIALAGGALKSDRMSVESAFVGYKDHEPWGGGVFSEIRVGGGGIHYSPVNAAFGTGGTTSTVHLFRGTWGVAAEVAVRIGVRISEGLTIFAGGEGRVAEGPREGGRLPFTVSSNSFFTAAAEAGLEFGF